MIHYVPLESLNERYTEQWSRWIPSALEKTGQEFCIVQGKPLTSKIESGSVLDSEGTNYFKFSQLMTIMQGIREGAIADGDTLLFADLWFPGIEAIRYSTDQRKIKVNITGILHAGTWDKDDFTYRCGMRSWGQHLEASWFHIYDQVYLGSEYHKQMILRETPEARHMADRMFVTGLPFDYKEVRSQVATLIDDLKPHQVVFPNRLDPEKQPWRFDSLKVGEGWNKTKTAEHFTTKQKYYQELSESRIAISYSLQETFGYAMLEALTLGCIVLLPDGLSYRETFSEFPKWRYKTYNELQEIVSRLTESEYTPKFYEEMKPDEATATKQLERFMPDRVVGKWVDLISQL